MRGNEQINMADTQESGGMEMKRKQCEAFTIDFVQSGGQKESLQDAFLKFQKDKQVHKAYAVICCSTGFFKNVRWLLSYWISLIIKMYEKG